MAPRSMLNKGWPSSTPSKKRNVVADADGESPRKARSHHDVWSKLPADVRESAETPATSSTATSSGGYELHASQKHALHTENPPSSSWWQEKVRVMSDSGTSKCLHSFQLTEPLSWRRICATREKGINRIVGPRKS